MGTFYRYSNLTTKGNHRLVEAGLDVISNEDNQKYNFFVGQPIAYNPFDGKTLSIADIATAKAVRFGVGHNPNKKALMATEIRHLGGGNYIDLCKTMLDIKVSQPGCPTPFVIDFDFGCTWTGRDYMFQLDIDDWLTRSYFKEGAVGSMLYNLRTDLSGCQSCSEEENCDALADQLADKINGDYIKDFPGTSKLGLNTGMPGQGVWAVQKFESTRTFTIAASAVENTCGEGCAVKGLKSISATGITTKTFVNAVDPSAPTQTLVEQLASVISQMNTAVSGHGSVYLKKVDCCTYEIEANTDLSNLVITYHDDSTADFEDAATVFAAGTTCGVRVYMDPLELPCHCQYPDNNPPSYFHRTAKITAWGDGWNDTSYEATIVSKGSIAVGTGYEVQQNELKQSNGGEGWDYAYGASYSDGRYPLPLDSSAYNQASVADCDGLYCIWSVVVQDHFAPSQHARNVQNSQSVNWVNVPRGDSDTIEDIEALFTALAERGFCSSAVIECVPASS